MIRLAESFETVISEEYWGNGQALLGELTWQEQQWSQKVRGLVIAIKYIEIYHMRKELALLLCDLTG